MQGHESTKSRKGSGKIQIGCVACKAGRKLPHRPSQRVVTSGFYSGWQPVTSGVLQGSIPGPMLFNIFISVLEDETESICTRFAIETKLSGDVAAGRSTSESDLSKLTEGASKNCMGFNTDTSKVLHLGQNNQ